MPTSEAASMPPNTDVPSASRVSSLQLAPDFAGLAVRSHRHTIPFSEPLPAQGTIGVAMWPRSHRTSGFARRRRQHTGMRIGRSSRGRMCTAASASGPAELPDGGPVSAEAGPSSSPRRAFHLHTNHPRASAARTAAYGWIRPGWQPTRSRECLALIRQVVSLGPSRDLADPALPCAGPCASGRTRDQTGSAACLFSCGSA